MYFFGLNKSEMKIFGKINCFIIVKSKKVYVDLLVVADESMSYDAVLGRVFMNLCNMKIVCEEEINQRKSNVSREDVNNYCVETENDIFTLNQSQKK